MTEKELLEENNRLRERLEEVEETLRAIRSGEVDALLVAGPEGEQVFTLKGAEYPYRAIFESINEGLLVLRPDSSILSTNLSFAEMVRKPMKKIIGTPFLEFLFEGDIGNIRDALRQALTENIKMELPLKTIDGAPLPVYLSLKMLEIENEKNISMVVTDMSQQKVNEQLEMELELRRKAEAELIKSNEELKATQDASLSIMEDMDIQTKKLHAAIIEKDALMSQVARINKELNDFAYIVSHDLKAPLRAISQLADWLQEDYTEVLDDAGKETLKVLKNRAVRMHNMIEGILQFSRVGRVEGKPEIVDTDKLVKQIVDSLAPPENIRIAVQDGLPQVVFDPLRINQIFQNLISNAIKYMDKPEGIIEVGCRDADNFHEFFVKDNGPGIEERHFELIFQIFQTLKPKDEFESTGIGLTIVKKIIEQNGGRIWVESEVGKGSTFRFTIPKKKT